jgi:hypothetical protein
MNKQRFSMRLSALKYHAPMSFKTWACPNCDHRLADVVHESLLADVYCPGCQCCKASEFVPVPAFKKKPKKK